MHVFLLLPFGKSVTKEYFLLSHWKLETLKCLFIFADALLLLVLDCFLIHKENRCVFIFELENV